MLWKGLEELDQGQTSSQGMGDTCTCHPSPKEQLPNTWPTGDIGQNLSELAHGLGGAVTYPCSKIPTLGTCWSLDSGVAHSTIPSLYPASTCQAPYYHPFWMRSLIKFWHLTPKVACTICPILETRERSSDCGSDLPKAHTLVSSKAVPFALKLCNRALQIRRFHLQTNSSRGFLGPGFPLWPSLTLSLAHKAIFPEPPPSNYSPSYCPPPTKKIGQTTHDDICLWHSGFSYQRRKLKTSNPGAYLLLPVPNPTSKQSVWIFNLKWIKEATLVKKDVSVAFKISQLMNIKFHSSPWEGDLLTHKLYTSSVARAAFVLGSRPQGWACMSAVRSAQSGQPAPHAPSDRAGRQEALPTDRLDWSGEKSGLILYFK